MARIMLVFAALVMGVFVWSYTTGSRRSSERLERALQLDPRKVEPSTRALVLLETLPDLRSADREVAVQRLRSTLEAIPRRIIAHHPGAPVEAIRFPGVGRTVLWYGKAADGIIIELWNERASDLASWSSASSGATFLDEAGTVIFKDQGLALNVVMSRDGGYLSNVENGALAIWGVQDVANRPGGGRPLFLAEMPYATTRLHCVRPAGICGVDSPGRFTIIDVKKGRILRSIAPKGAATVHMSPSGGFVGVLDSRGAGMTIHATRQDTTIGVDAPSVALEDFAFGADEKSVVALDSDGMLHSYDVATGKPRARFPVVRHEGWKGSAHVETVGDGRFVVWGAEKVRLVSADLSTVAARFDEGGEVVMVKTNERGDRLAIARRTGPLTLWDISTKPTLPLVEAELKDAACDRIGRPLAPEEWATYFPDRRYFPSCR
jgi:hypothetical protein